MSTRDQDQISAEEELRWLGLDADGEEIVDRVDFHFKLPLDRRDFVKLLGAGLLIGVAAHDADAQERGRGRGGGGRGGGGGPRTLSARLHIGKDGVITVMTSKVECGQGSRAELTQAAAEELGVAPAAVTLIMADTSLVPDDGGTAGSRTTPSTVPSIRQGCAAARSLLVALAAKRWSVDAAAIKVSNGRAGDGKPEHALTYADLAADEESAKSLGGEIPRDVKLTPVAEWKVLGASLARPNAADIVTGRHHYPSDEARPGMQHGKILRRPSYGAKLLSLDPAAAKAMKDVQVVQDGEFVGVAAPTSWQAEKALAALEAAAKWETAPHPASATIFEHLRKTAQGGMPKNPLAAELTAAAKTVRQNYDVAYIQHCPMEPRAALAMWEDGKLTVWTASQQPSRVKGELTQAFNLPEDKVRVIVPDFGGGFGGKHSGECAVEAARLAKSAGKPVRLCWTRAEEFTWAQFRPAAAIDTEATLDASGAITSWHFINVNSGGASLRTPYRAGKTDERTLNAAAPLRHGSYRGLASTANSFARESLMDELALAAGKDPLEFRLAHLEPGRLRDVLTRAAEKFDWKRRVKEKSPDAGVGLACSIDKGSFVACCAEVAVKDQVITVKHVCQAYDCGKVLNPDNLMRQVKGAIVMGIGPALREESRFENGVITNATFRSYLPARFEDVPSMNVVLVDRPEMESVGAGETPLIVIAPAIANAVFHATGKRIRQMPIRLEAAK